MNSFNPLTEKAIYSTVDFYLDLDEETIDQIHNELWHGYALWHHERQKTPVEEGFKERKKLLIIPDKKKKPWDWGDTRANTPISLFNHLWGIGHFRKSPYFFSLLAFAITAELQERKEYWNQEILETVIPLLHLEKEIYKAGNNSYKDWKKQQTKGLTQYAEEQSYHKNALEKQIHEQASEYINQGKEKKHIVSLIYKHSKIKNLQGNPMQERSIRRYLKSHPLGFWK